MLDDELKFLIQSLGSSITSGQSDPTGTVAMLISETVKFRDKLKENTGQILTVGDTRVTLDALHDYLKGNPVPETLTPRQNALLKIWIDRLTIFDY